MDATEGLYTELLSVLKKVGKFETERQMNRSFVRLLHEAYHLTNLKEK
jgi:hypothetical protein